MKAIDFLALMTVGQLGMEHPSLAGMVEAVKVAISREGMHRRFTDTAVAFMRRCTEFVPKQKASEMIRLQSKILQHFKRILIFDSTGWDIAWMLSQAMAEGHLMQIAKYRPALNIKAVSLRFSRLRQAPFRTMSTPLR
jgi:hypothetical protein